MTDQQQAIIKTAWLRLISPVKFDADVFDPERIPGISPGEYPKN